jgi:HPt (histidine-containing phosphotransfer) domain-containing protein
METHHSQPIDRAFLARFTLGNAALEREILELFAQQVPLYVEQLRKAPDARAWKEAAHGIKGAALAVGAHGLARRALEAEGLHNDAASAVGGALRLRSADAVAAASAEVCGYIACLFATA